MKAVEYTEDLTTDPNSPEMDALIEEIKQKASGVSNDEDSYYQRVILNGIQDRVSKGHPIYQGTVTPNEKAKRRAKNKRARAARRNNRD